RRRRLYLTVPTGIHIIRLRIITGFPRKPVSSGNGRVLPLAEYANPRALVDTEWVARHLDDPRVKLVEVDVETEAYYEDGHIPGALCWNWQTELQDPVRRDILDREQMEALLVRSG